MSSTTPGSSAPVQFIVEAETTVKVPMLRPKPSLLKVLHLSGGVGQTFCMGEIIQLVRDYISERTLYDQQDPRIVHCRGDLLGEALNVESFTVNEALALFRKNCTQDPDSCFRIRRQLMTRAVNSSDSCSVTSTKPNLQPSSVTSESSPSSSSSCINVKIPCSNDSTDSMIPSCSHPAAEASVIITDSDMEKCSSDSQQQETRVRRRRSTSINVTYDEPDAASGPWSCAVQLETSADDGNKPEDDTVIVEYDSDTFSVEYEVASSSESGNKEGQMDDSDLVSDSSSTSGNAVLIVCKESDVEYLADYSDSDHGSDTELTEADKWYCDYCKITNPPFQRNCAGCWSVRPDWLPQKISVTTDYTVSASKHETSASQQKTSASQQETSASQQKTSPSQQKTAASQPETSPSQQKTPASVCRYDEPDSSHTQSQDNLYSVTKSSQENPDYLTTSSQENADSMTRSSQEKNSASKVSKDASDSSDNSDDKMEDVDPAELSSEDGGGSKKETGASKNLCVICFARKKTASLVHGKSGHQACCYRCAKKLKRQRKSCPICRKPIQKVIRNFTV